MLEQRLQHLLTFDTLWRRGKATIERDWVRLDLTRSEIYNPATYVTQFPADPPLVAALMRLDEPSEVVQFVAEHGLLFHGPTSRASREKLSDFFATSRRFREYAFLAMLIRAARHGISSAHQQLREDVEPQYRRLFPEPPTTDEECLTRMTEVWSRAISREMAGLTLGAGSTGPGELVLQVQSLPSLVSVAAFQLLQTATQQRPVFKCANPDCPEYFFRHDKRQIYCSDRCSGRVRFQRWTQTHTRTEKEHY